MLVFEFSFTRVALMYFVDRNTTSSLLDVKLLHIQIAGQILCTFVFSKFKTK